MKSEPQQKIHRITNTFPNNPASPFFGQGEIPPLGVLTLRRIHPKTGAVHSNVCTGNETIEPSDINEGVTGQLDLHGGADGLTDMDRQKFLMMQGKKDHHNRMKKKHAAWYLDVLVKGINKCHPWIASQNIHPLSSLLIPYAPKYSKILGSTFPHRKITFRSLLVFQTLRRITRYSVVEYLSLLKTFSFSTKKHLFEIFKKFSEFLENLEDMFLGYWLWSVVSGQWSVVSGQ